MAMMLSLSKRASVSAAFANHGLICVDEYFVGASTCLADALVFRLAEIDPGGDVVGQVLVPDVGLIFGADAFGEGEALAGVQGESDDADHQSLLGFRRMLGHGELMGLVIVTVHVGDHQFRFQDCRFCCHGLSFFLMFCASLLATD